MYSPSPSHFNVAYWRQDATFFSGQHRTGEALGLSKLLYSYLFSRVLNFAISRKYTLKARFLDGEILREKFWLRNMDGCTWVIVLKFLTLSAFTVSRIDFYSLAKRDFFSRKVIALNAHAFIHFARNFSHFAKKKRSWNQALRQCAMFLL